MRFSGLVVLACAVIVAGITGCASKAPPPYEAKVLGAWDGHLSREIDNKRFALHVEFKRTHQGVLTHVELTDGQDGRVYKSSSYADVNDRQIAFRGDVPDWRDLEPRHLFFHGKIEQGGILWGTYEQHESGAYATYHSEDMGVWRVERK